MPTQVARTALAMYAQIQVRLTRSRSSQIVALDGLRPADALLLDAFADKTSDRAWTLSSGSLLRALHTKHILKELRCYLAQTSAQPLPQTIATLLDDTERRLGKVRYTGPVHLIECADDALATLLAGDRRLRALCTRLGEWQLAVPAEKLPAFRKALLAQGYPLA